MNTNIQHGRDNKCINTSGSSVRRKNDPVDYIYIYLLSLATPARSATSLSIRVLGPQAAFTPSIWIASEGAFGLYTYNRQNFVWTDRAPSLLPHDTSNINHR